jgi:hypothetical protein
MFWILGSVGGKVSLGHWSEVWKMSSGSGYLDEFRNRGMKIEEGEFWFWDIGLSLGNGFLEIK